MSIDPKYGRYCDECGRGIVKAIRVHIGNDYCRACYQRTFLPVPCSVCAQQMRAHRHENDAPVCGACARVGRTCLRCGRLTPVAGKIVGKSAVCAACSPRFREARPCACCGRLSARLSRALSVEMEDPVCDSCRNKLTHATCVTCKRYRVVVGHSIQGEYCGHCVPGAEETHRCPDCGCEVSGGGLGRCRPCIASSAIRKDATFIGAEFEHMWLRELWDGFVETQLAGDCDAPNLRRQTARSAEFFRQLAQAFDNAESITPRSLAERIDSKIHRTHLLASRFVVAKLKLSEFDDARFQHTEQVRIADILEEGCDRPHHAVLATYATWLVDQNIAVRTARMYLRAAENFCAHCKLDGVSAWPAALLLSYLIASPGQAASLNRFVTYCQSQLDWKVRFPPKKLWESRSNNTSREIHSLRKTVKVLEDRPESKIATKELARLLSLALGVPAAVLLRERANKEVKRHHTGAIEITAAALIKPEHPLYRYARRWADLSDKYRAR